MGSTPIHGIPFADPTDLVRDWPALSEDVALAIEAALEDISVPQKRIEAFTGSGTFTVPAGVTYAIAHMLGGGGGVASNNTAGDGGVSSVNFASGLVTSNGGVHSGGFGGDTAVAALANTGRGAMLFHNSVTGQPQVEGGSATYTVAGAPVTPAASITVTVGAGGTAGTGGAAGGSGYVYIEFFEEV